MNNFLQKHQVDVCRSLAVLGFAAAISDILSMVVSPAFYGKLSINIGPIFTIWFSCALWARRSWIRKLLIGVSWLAVVAFVGVSVKSLFFGGVALTLNGTKVADPTSFQYLSVFVTVVPILTLMMMIFHSAKFREEVSEPKSHETRT